jgi:hypothetical protein
MRGGRPRLLISEMPSNVVPIASGLFKALPRNDIVLPVLFEARSRP